MEENGGLTGTRLEGDVRIGGTGAASRDVSDWFDKKKVTINKECLHESNQE